MEITIEFKNVDKYLEFKEKTAQEERPQEQFVKFEIKPQSYIKI